MHPKLIAVLAMTALSACTVLSPENPCENGTGAFPPREANDRLLAQNPGGGFQCSEVKALIPIGGKVEGPDCRDNKAVVNGWSVKCVANGACNTPQRRRELNGAAESFCADWCAAKQCDFRYAARSQCDSAWCLTSQSCRANCNVPMRDTCFFQQAAPNYNCECVDPPPPDSPPPVEG